MEWLKLGLKHNWWYTVLNGWSWEV